MTSYPELNSFEMDCKGGHSKAMTAFENNRSTNSEMFLIQKLKIRSTKVKK